MSKDSTNNGMTQKEMLLLLLEGQEENSNDADENQCQALQRCRVSKQKTNKLGECNGKRICNVRI